MDVLQVDRSDRKILLKRSTKYETQPYKWMEKRNGKKQQQNAQSGWQRTQLHWNFPKVIGSESEGEKSVFCLTYKHTFKGLPLLSLFCSETFNGEFVKSK